MNMLQPIIGLEIHIQLKTNSKLFCSCSVHEGAVAPNTNVCPICLGHPGTLPTPNEQAVAWTILAGHALGCDIADRSKFDRKNYFYPDLPKAYQISQFDIPVASDGELTIETPGADTREQATIGITRIHLEEDAAKSFHDESGKTYVDFNRGGTPLIEIVTEPDFRTPREAKVFLKELRLIARYLGISDADMEKGHLRCDANISLQKRDEDGNVVGKTLNPKTEIKNLNSFKHVERALEYEIQRQEKLWKSDTPPAVETTRGWNTDKQKTVEQRSKEEAADYRYFPEPDIPPMHLTEMAEEIETKLPELPAARRQRFIEEYKLRRSDAKQICADPVLADFTEHVFSELHAWLNALPEMDDVDRDGERWEKEQKRLAKLVADWELSKLRGLLSEHGIGIRTMKISQEDFAELITLIATKKLSKNAALTVLEEMLMSGADPSHIMEEQELGRIEDTEEINTIVERILEQNPDEVVRYLEGEEQLLKFFIGMVMKATEGTADPKLTRNILVAQLEDAGE